MNQADLALDPHVIEASDPEGFDLGWEHARHGLVPPAELLLEGTPIGQGWRAGKAVFGHRPLAASRRVRQWLVLRTRAWREGAPFDRETVTPEHLARLAGGTCPVTRLALGGAPDGPTAPVIDRIDPAAAYAAGNLVTLSRAAAAARAGVDAVEAMRRARLQQAAAQAPLEELDAAAWWRLAVLRSFASPLPFAQAAALPLAMLPPSDVRVSGAVQALQVRLTLCFAEAGWSDRLRAIGQWLPEPVLRTEFQLFVGALAPRVVEAASQDRDMRLALEDAWLAERVQRRWRQFVLALGEAGVETLLRQLAAQPGRAARTAFLDPAGGAAQAPASLRIARLAPAPTAARRRTDRPRSRPAPHVTADHRPSAT